jgi:glycosyltransferase involved in cell wall biosynthesis
LKFSIIIPSLNQGEFIDRAIRSIEGNAEMLKSGNAESGVEILVMDGGSEDGTLEILKRWKAETLSSYAQGYGGSSLRSKSAVTFDYVSEKDRGQTDAINKGLARASGDILAYLCADDFYEPGALAAVAQVFSEYPEVDLIYGDGYFLEGDSGWKRLKRTGECPPDRLKRRNPIMQPATFWRRQVYDQFGPFDDSLHYVMDNEYWLRICDRTTWYYLPQPIATAQMHPDAKTSSGLVAMWEEAATVAERYGCAGHTRLVALWMRWGGAFLYRWKRRILRTLGKWVVGR